MKKHSPYLQSSFNRRYKKQVVNGTSFKVIPASQNFYEFLICSPVTQPTENYRFTKTILERLTFWLSYMFPSADVGGNHEINIDSEHLKEDEGEVWRYLKEQNFKWYSHNLIFKNTGQDRGKVVIGIHLDKSDDGNFYNFEIVGLKAEVEKIQLFLQPFAMKNNQTISTIVNVSRTSGGVTTIGNTLQSKNDKELPILHSSYPYLEKEPIEILEAFMASRARLLILIGDPGTGKTTLLRELIRRNENQTVICNDPGLQKHREIYTSFLTNNKADLLVLEDADLVIAKRKEGNEIMPLLLNILDGVGHADKRIVITTNLDNIDDVDEALLRPGRCFDILKFRYLTREEAVVAVKALNLPESDLNIQSEWSLAELLNYNETMAVKRRTTKHSVGFVPR